MQPETLAQGSLSEGVFTGTVTHRRNFDVEHGFSYPLWMSLTDLSGSKLPRLLCPQLAKYFDRNHVESLVLNAVKRDSVAGEAMCDDQQVWLLTQPSLLGRSFNPVSFYFVTNGNRIDWIVAHITNTPWDEDHCYVLGRIPGHSWSFDKEFHVSPFMPMAMRYTWRFQVSAEQISIDMHLFKDEQRVFFAALNLSPQPATRWQALRLRLVYPLQNARTLLRIYYQAALLRLKGAQFYAHPNSTSTH